MASEHQTRFVPRQASSDGALRIGELDQRQDDLLSQLDELEQRTASLLKEWTQKRTDDEETPVDEIPAGQVKDDKPDDESQRRAA